jgi:transcriptional regulator with GAF, ATPase, and Fis domain
MDDLTFSARRASAATSVRTEAPDLDTHLNSRPEEAFDVESLMRTFGRLKRVPRSIPRTPRHGIDRGSVAVGAAVREMIGRDEKMLIVFEWIRTAAKSDISVLILGPTGSGKEVVARTIHELSRRSTARFQAVNCAALPDTLFESEIFGYEKGAFTGAHDRKPDRLELANDGTLFLDEIGDLSIMAQAKLLRVLEERRSKTFSREAIDLIISYPWPGNIRELESTASRAALSAPGRTIRATDVEFLHASPTAPPSQTGDRLPSLAEAERAHIVRVLETVD